MERLIFHVDVNSAFLSWEAARRVARGEPDLRLIPSAVGGDRDKRSGVILAKSIPSKKYGINTGEPVAMALRKCPNLVIVKPDFALYSENSRAFVKICRKYAPVVEQFSIDECYLDMTGTAKLYPDPIALAYQLKDEIFDTLGFTVNVGIGHNKLLAKMASDFEKPNKVHTLFEEEFEEKFYPLPIRDLFLVGRATAEKLDRVNISTIGQLASLPLEAVQSIIPGKFGKQLYDFAHGIDDSPVASVAEDAKCYGNSVTLEEDIHTGERGEQVLLALADSVTARLRAHGVKASVITVTLRDTKFNDRSKQHKLSAPTDLTVEAFEAAKSIFYSMWDRRTPIRLVGISMSDICTEGEQISLFEDEKRDKARKVDEVVDSIRRQFGRNTISRASTCESFPHGIGKEPNPAQKKDE